jgi:hypothetical protein
MRRATYPTRFATLRALALLLLAVGAMACLALVSAAPSHAQAAPLAQMRIIQTSFDTPAVDVYLGGRKMISNLGFKGVSRFLAVPAGSQSVLVTVAGRSDRVLQANVDLQSGKTYSVVALGRRADLTAKVLEDDLTALGPGKARLRVVHTSPDAPAVDVAVKGGSVLFPNLGLGDVSKYLTLDAATVDVELRPAGTTVVALSVPNLRLEAGKVYSAYGVGSLKGAPPLSVLAVADTAGTPRINEALPLTGKSEDPSLLPLFLLVVLIFGFSTLACGMSFRLLDYGYSALDLALWGKTPTPKARLRPAAVRWIKGILRKT